MSSQGKKLTVKTPQKLILSANSSAKNLRCVAERLPSTCEAGQWGGAGLEEGRQYRRLLQPRVRHRLITQPLGGGGRRFKTTYSQP